MRVSWASGQASFPALTTALALALGGCGGVIDTRPSETGGGGGGGPVPRPSGNVAGTGYIGPPASVGPDGCPLPWWGTSLEGVTGLLSCSDPFHPAMLAYGQMQYESCWGVTGPIGQSMMGNNLSCCYHFEESACGNAYQGDACIEMPYFGDGTADVQIPDGAVSFDSCDAPVGPKLVLTQQSRVDHLIGVWLRCGPAVPLFNGNAIVFRGDGTFQALQTNEQGRLEPAPGCDQSGLWGFLGSSPGQLNLHIGDRTTFLVPQFTGGSTGRLHAGDSLGEFVGAQIVP